LYWLVCVPYTGEKLGGWTSDNYLAFARLMSWFYSEISTVVRDFEFIEPLMPQKILDNEAEPGLVENS
jgi:hypothetical protein